MNKKYVYQVDVYNVTIYPDVPFTFDEVTEVKTDELLDWFGLHAEIIRMLEDSIETDTSDWINVEADFDFDVLGMTVEVE